ncbi:glycoside hydrolase superfamily [Blastocladiella britannica]|nr:glycoside hydrolase superfamily [Blastocladiella britannica]
MLRKYTPAAALLLVALLATSVLASVPSGKVNVAYYPNSRVYQGYPVTSLPVEELTHVVYAFANVRPDGSVVYSDPWIDAQQQVTVMSNPDGTGVPLTFNGQIALLNNWKSPIRKRNRALRSLISVGGWTGSQYFSSIAASPTLRKAFANSLAAFIDVNGFSGVDIDWEFPGLPGAAGTPYSDADPANFVLMLNDIRAAFTAQQKKLALTEPYILTAAVSGAFGKYKILDLVGMSKAVDFMLMMAYEFSGVWSAYTGHATPWTLVNVAISDWITTWGVPANKIVLGLAFYGKSFSGVSLDPENIAYPGNSFTNNPAPPGTFESGVVTFDDLAANYFRDGTSYTRWVDPVEHVPVLASKQTGIWISYEDYPSIYAKGALVAARKLRGVFSWDPSFDRGPELVYAAVNGMAKPSDCPKYSTATTPPNAAKSTATPAPAAAKAAAPAAVSVASVAAAADAPASPQLLAVAANSPAHPASASQPPNNGQSVVKAQLDGATCAENSIECIGSTAIRACVNGKWAVSAAKAGERCAIVSGVAVMVLA